MTVTTGAGETAEAALRASEARYRLATEVARLGTWTWDLRTGAASVDGRVAELFGLDAAAPPPWAEVLATRVHPDDRARVAAALAAAAAPDGGGRYHEAFRVVRPDGTERWVRSAGQVQCDEGPGGAPHPARVVGTVLDVTDEQAREAALHAREAQLEAVLRQLPVGVILAEAPSGRLLLANAQSEAIWRHPPRPAAGVPEYRAYPGFHPEDGRPYAPEEWPLARAVQRGETVTGEEIDFRRGDGTAGTMRVSAAPVRDADGRVSTAAVVFEDVTLLRAAADAARAERAARAAADFERRRLETLVEHLPVGVMFAEAPGGRLIMRNAAVRRIWGADTLASGVAEYSTHYVGYLPDTGRRYASDEWPLARALARGEVVTDEVIEVERPDGTRAAVSVSAAPVRGADGGVAAAVVTSRDVTEQRRARAEIERLLGESEAARDRADRLQALTTALAATTTPEEVADVVVAQGVAATGASTGMLALRVAPPTADGPGEAAMLRHQGLSRAVIEAYTRFPLSRAGPMAECLRTGQVLFVEDGGALRARFPDVAHLFDGMGTQAVATVPLVVAGEAVGAMSFSWAGPRALSDAERALFLAFGHQAAQALERARLFEAERAARTAAEAAAARATLLQDLTAALSQAVTREQVAGVVIDRVAGALGAHLGVLALLTPDGGRLAVAAADRLRDATWREWATFPLDAPVPLAEAARTGRPVVLTSFGAIAAHAPAIAELCRAYGTAAMCTIPVAVPGGPVLGALGLSFPAPRALGDEAGLLETLAGQAAQAIERVRLFEAERAARAEAEAARSAAEAANRAKSEFLAVMSHELRTPLNAIAGYAELLEMGIRGPVTAQQREDLGRIQRSQRHLLGLVNEVLNYARLESGAVHFDVAPVALREALAGAEALVAPQARAKGLALVVAACPPELAARADAEKVRQVLVNLLSNAVKFTDRGGRVELACAAAAGDGGRVHVTVRDTGIGIAPHQQARIFDPFVQVRADLTRTAEGAGLGLAISRDLARGMGGDLTVESAPGAGSTFTLALPRAD